jgi:dissimilatory sulfite reductase (desulfoviridin) alpha/beta subunit
MVTRTFAIDDKTKGKLKELKERMRVPTYKEVIVKLLSLYEQLAPQKRGEEIEFVEAIERGRVQEFLQRKLDVNTSTQTTQTVEKKEEKSEKRKIRI